MHLLAIYVSSYVRYLFKFFAHFLLVVFFLLIMVVGSVNILDISPLLVICALNIFIVSLSVSCPRITLPSRISQTFSKCFVKILLLV